MDWSYRVDNANPLFFIKDKLSGVKFLIGTGTTCSLFSASQTKVYSVQSIPEMTCDFLPTLGRAYLKVEGSYCTSIDQACPAACLLSFWLQASTSYRCRFINQALSHCGSFSYKINGVSGSGENMSMILTQSLCHFHG